VENELFFVDWRTYGHTGWSWLLRVWWCLVHLKHILVNVNRNKECIIKFDLRTIHLILFKFLLSLFSQSNIFNQDSIFTECSESYFLQETRTACQFSFVHCQVTCGSHKLLTYITFVKRFSAKIVSYILSQKYIIIRTCCPLHILNIRYHSTLTILGSITINL
jgi:hypothetical protein